MLRTELYAQEKVETRVSEAEQASSSGARGARQGFGFASARAVPPGRSARPSEPETRRATALRLSERSEAERTSKLAHLLRVRRPVLRVLRPVLRVRGPMRSIRFRGRGG